MIAPERSGNATPEAIVDAFYRERVPNQFNRTLAAQREAARRDPGAARVLEEMEAVRSAIVVQVDTGAALQRYCFEIERGEMAFVERLERAPFLVLGHSIEDFPNLHRECGDSLLGFLGGLAGLGDEMRLTAHRVRSLRELAGGLIFERIGEGGFALFAQFGPDASAEGTSPAADPRATIRLDTETYRALRAGELDAQDAFLAGRVETLGDESMAIGLALAALAPD